MAAFVVFGDDRRGAGRILRRSAHIAAVSVAARGSHLAEILPYAVASSHIPRHRHGRRGYQRRAGQSFDPGRRIYRRGRSLRRGYHLLCCLGADINHIHFSREHRKRAGLSAPWRAGRLRALSSHSRKADDAPWRADRLCRPGADQIYCRASADPRRAFHPPGRRVLL